MICVRQNRSCLVTRCSEKKNRTAVTHCYPVILSEMTLNYYRDTTLVAGKTYRYTVSAIDFYGNESAGSVSPLYVPEASTVIAPEIIRAVNTVEGILISWGQVTDEKAVSVKVYRSRAGMQPIPVFTLQKTSDEYLDKTVSEGELYTYEISVITEGDSESARSSGVTVRRQSEN